MKEFDLDELEKLLKELVDKALEQYDAGYAVDLEGEYKQVSKRLLKAHTAALDEAYKQGYIAAGVEALKGERHRQPYNSESELDSTTPQLSKYYKEGQ